MVPRYTENQLDRPPPHPRWPRRTHTSQMSLKQFTFIEEPRQDAYRLLVDYSTELCCEAQLVVRDTVECSPRAVAVLESLEPWLVQQARVSAWPGTKLHRTGARLFRYRLGSESASILASAVGKLYDWTQPDRPEDLALMFADGTPWLTTIVHEEDGYLTMSDEQADAFFRVCDRLSPLLGPGMVPP